MNGLWNYNNATLDQEAKSNLCRCLLFYHEFCNGCEPSSEGKKGHSADGSGGGCDVSSDLPEREGRTCEELKIDRAESGENVLYWSGMKITKNTQEIHGRKI